MIKKLKNNLLNYELIIFDSDGVILNSNKVKETAFIKLAREYNVKSSELEIINLIRNHKGKSRYEIIKDLLVKIKNKEIKCELLYKELLLRYSEIVEEKLETCESSNKLKVFRKKNKSSWLVLTAGDERETINIYKKRGIYKFFDLGILGAPRLKKDNLNYLNNIHKNILLKKILYIGDSINDFELARECNFDFILIKDWSTCTKIKDETITSLVNNYSSLDEFINDYLQYIY